MGKWRERWEIFRIVALLLLFSAADPHDGWAVNYLVSLSPANTLALKEQCLHIHISASGPRRVSGADIDACVH